MIKSIYKRYAVCLVAIFALMMTGMMMTVSAAETDEMGQDFIRANLLLGRIATDDMGNQLGQINDIVIGKDGKVSYLVLSREMGEGKPVNLVPIPYNDVNISLTQEQLTLKNMTQAKFEKAPSFTAVEWEKLAKSHFEEQIRGYFRGTIKEEMPSMENF